MIKSIKIQNYKLFKSFSLKKLSPMVLISGKNNCGKTSVLESVFMSLDCGAPDMFLKHLGWRGLNTFYNNAESLFAPSFYNFNLNEAITFEYFINSSKKKLSYKFLKPSPSQSIVVSEPNKIELKKKLDNTFGGVEISYGAEGSNSPKKALLTLEVNRFNITPNSLLKYNENMMAAFLASTKLTSPDEDSSRYGELERLKNTQEILKRLQILDPNLQSLSVIPMGGKPIIYGDSGMKIQIPLSLMGQGIVRLSSILLAISEVKKGIVLIDELENGFHHSVLPLIWKAITSYAKFNETQIIATTHSRELIEGAIEGISEELRSDFKYIRIEREKDKFKTKDYTFEDLKVSLGAELEIR